MDAEPSSEQVSLSHVPSKSAIGTALGNVAVTISVAVPVSPRLSDTVNVTV